MAPPLRAELFALRRRPAVYLVCAIWAAQVLAFSYLVPYLITRGDTMPAADAQRLFASLLPDGVDTYILGGLPLFGGPVVLGALLSTSDYCARSARSGW